MLTQLVVASIDGVAIAQLMADQHPGSMRMPPAPGSGRPPRMLLFGWIENEPGVWESKLGWDLEAGVTRVIGSANLVKLSMLYTPYELDYWTSRPPRTVHKLRFELVGTHPSVSTR
jgi:hypothetical protein